MFAFLPLAQAADPAWGAAARSDGGFRLPVPDDVRVDQVLHTGDGRVWVAGFRTFRHGWIGLLAADGTVKGIDVGDEPLRDIVEVNGGVATSNGRGIVRVTPDLGVSVLQGPFVPAVGFDAFGLAQCGGVVVMVGLHNPSESGVSELWQVTGSVEWRSRPGGYASLTDVECGKDGPVSVGSRGEGGHYEMLVVRGESVELLPRTGWTAPSAVLPDWIVGVTYAEPVPPPYTGGDILLLPLADIKGDGIRIPADAFGVDATMVGATPVVASWNPRGGALWALQGGAPAEVAALPTAFSRGVAPWDDHTVAILSRDAEKSVLRLVAIPR